MKPAQYMITDRKSTRLNSSHLVISYAVFCLKKNRPAGPCAHGQHASPVAQTHAPRQSRCHAGGVGGVTPHASSLPCAEMLLMFLFFFNDAAPTEISTLSLHDALPI